MIKPKLATLTLAEQALATDILICAMKKDYDSFGIRYNKVTNKPKTSFWLIFEKSRERLFRRYVKGETKMK